MEGEEKRAKLEGAVASASEGQQTRGTGVDGEGMCQLCFSSDRSWFQGRVLPAAVASRQLGLFGQVLSEEEEEEELSRSKDPSFHRCCFSHQDPPSFYRVTVIDFASSTRQTLPIVACTNGDLAKLECSELRFRTDTIKIDDEARSFVADFFPKMAGERDALVCIGSIDLSRLPAPAQQQQQQQQQQPQHEQQQQPKGKRGPASVQGARRGQPARGSGSGSGDGGARVIDWTDDEDEEDNGHDSHKGDDTRDGANEEEVTVIE